MEGNRWAAQAGLRSSSSSHAQAADKQRRQTAAAGGGAASRWGVQLNSAHRGDHSKAQQQAPLGGNRWGGGLKSTGVDLHKGEGVQSEYSREAEYIKADRLCQDSRYDAGPDLAPDLADPAQPTRSDLAPGAKAFVEGVGACTVISSASGRVRVEFPRHAFAGHEFGAAGRTVWLERSQVVPLEHAVPEDSWAAWTGGRLDGDAVESLKALLCALPDVRGFFTKFSGADRMLSAQELQYGLVETFEQAGKGAVMLDDGTISGGMFSLQQCQAIVDLADVDGDHVLALGELEEFANVLQEVQSLRAELGV